MLSGLRVPTRAFGGEITARLRRAAVRGRYFVGPNCPAVRCRPLILPRESSLFIG
jgi:hypothetical protein